MQISNKNLRRVAAGCLTAVYLIGGRLPVTSVRSEEKPAVSETKSALQIAIDAGNSDLTAAYAPKAAIVVDGTSGRILFSENADAPRVPASLTKLMTLYLTYEAMKEGKFDENTKVRANEKYLDISGRFSLSNHKIVPGQEFTVKELIDALIVPSSAAAAFMLADLVMPNDTEGFIKKMNDTAARLKMVNTHYENPIGSPNLDLSPYLSDQHDPNADNQITARDYAILVSHFIAEYPQVLNHTASSKITMSAGTPQEATYDGHNYSLPGQELYRDGIDGFKTGSSPAAGYNVVASAKRGDTRLVAVVLGVSSWVDLKAEYNRARIVNALLEYCFAKYEYRSVLKAGEQTVGGEAITLATDLMATVPKGEQPELLKQNDRVMLSTPGEYLPGYSAPGAAYRLTAALAAEATQTTTAAKPGIAARLLRVVKFVLKLSLGIIILFSLFVVIMLIRKQIILRRRRRRRASRRAAKRRRQASKRGL